MNCLHTNAPVTDMICILPVAQQVIGFGSIILSIAKIAKEAFLFLYEAFQFAHTALYPYPIITYSKSLDFSLAEKKAKEIAEKNKNPALTSVQLQLLQKEAQDLGTRVEKEKKFIEKLSHHLRIKGKKWNTISII